MLFEQFKLNANVLRGIHASGYMLPTPLQEEFVPAALSGRDIYAYAYAGGGKTAAYALPALQRLLKRGFSLSSGPRILIVAPTRNAVMQAGKLIKQIGKYMRFRLVMLAQGLNSQQQYEELQPEQVIDILIATPQRLSAYMQTGVLDFSRLEMLIFDEADRMEESMIVNLHRTLPRQKQTVIITNEEAGGLEKTAIKILQKPAIVKVESGQSTGRSLRHYLYACDDEEHKFKVLRALLAERARHCLVVVREEEKAEDIDERLQKEGVSSALLSRDPQDRREQLERFTAASIVAIINSNEEPMRGVEYQSVNTIIHYDVPAYPEHYLQRVAPLAQARDNVAIILAHAADSSNVNTIEHLMGYHFTPRTVDGLEPELPFYRPKIKLKRDHLGRIVRRAQFNQDNRGGGGGGNNKQRGAKQKSGHLRMLRRMPKQDN